MPFIDVKDCRLFYQIDDFTDAWTSPDTVLFVHGFTECTEAWRAWVPHFSRRFRMVRIDQRGFGQSGAVAKDYKLTTELYIDDLLMQSFFIQRSTGRIGFIAQECQAKFSNLKFFEMNFDTWQKSEEK